MKVTRGYVKEAFQRIVDNKYNYVELELGMDNYDRGLIDTVIDKYFNMIERILDTAKKVERLSDDRPVCPSCRDIIKDDKQEFCEYCGQRLDWVD